MPKPEAKKRKRDDKQANEKRTKYWMRFLSDTVKEFRRLLDNELTPEELTFFHSKEMRARDSIGLSLAKPTQIIVFEFVEPFPIAFIITHNPEIADGSFHVFEHIKNPEEFEKEITKLKPSLFENVDTRWFLKDVKEEAGWDSSWSYGKNGAILLFREKEARTNPRYIARSLFQSLKRELSQRFQQDQIGKMAIDLKRDALEISEPQTRAKILEASDKIEEALLQMKRLDKYERKLGLIEKEIGGVRRLIGVTKEYQDFKILTSVVDEMKKDHIGKALFDETVKRVDGRIDGLSKRLDDMKTIKFWTKRTAVEVILAAIMVASALITALLSAGILHF